jgi:hypothetical protein
MGLPQRQAGNLQFWRSLKEVNVQRILASIEDRLRKFTGHLLSFVADKQEHEPDFKRPQVKKQS